MPTFTIITSTLAKLHLITLDIGLIALNNSKHTNSLFWSKTTYIFLSWLNWSVHFFHRRENFRSFQINGFCAWATPCWVLPNRVSQMNSSIAFNNSTPIIQQRHGKHRNNLLYLTMWWLRHSVDKHSLNLWFNPCHRGSMPYLDTLVQGSAESLT